MKVEQIYQGIHQWEKQIVSQTAAAVSPVCLGNNPCLPSILQQTWKWPYVCVAFRYRGKMIAWISAVRVGHSWISLPHFDHGSLWVNFEMAGKIMNDFKGEGQTWLRNLLYAKLSWIINEYATGVDQNTILDVDLEDLDFLSSFNINYNPFGIKMACRSRFKFLRYHQSGKIIPQINLMPSYEEQMTEFNGSVRRKIRKSEKNGITLKTGGVELLNDFYRVYRKNIHHLGSFGLPKQFFKNLIGNYKFGQATVVMAMYQGIPAGAGILLTYLDFAENAWFASIKDFNRLYVTYALHAGMIRLAIKGGIKVYSFGRSTANSPVHHYKKQWGTRDVPLYFNSTVKSFDYGKLQSVLPHMIKLMPAGFMRWFDKPVSGFIY